MTEGTATTGRSSSRFGAVACGLADRVLTHLRLLDGDFGGFAVDRLEHSLQTATRAYRAGEDEEYVVCALLHDIGDTLGPYNHSDIAAAIVKPFVSEENHWMVDKHAVFQGYYFFHHLGLDRDVRDEFRDHPWFDRTATFCESTTRRRSTRRARRCRSNTSSPPSATCWSARAAASTWATAASSCSRFPADSRHLRGQPQLREPHAVLKVATPCSGSSTEETRTR